MTVFADYGTVSGIEVIWVLIAAIGLVYSVRNVHDALDDLRNLYEPPPPRIRHWSWWRVVQANFGHGPLVFRKETNGRYAIALATTRVESYRLIIQLVFITIGVLAWLIGDSEPGAQPWKYVAIGVAVRWGLILASFLVTLQSIENRRMRNMVRAAYDEGGKQ